MGEVKKRRQINLSPLLIRELAALHNTSTTNVRAALNWYNNSQLAKKIRQSAKENLLYQAKNIPNEE